MKKLFPIIALFIMLSVFMTEVSAYSKDIEVKFEKTTNIVLNRANINNNTVSLVIDNHNFQISSSLNNVEVIIVKAQNDAYNYINSKTNSNQNYYISFYQNNKKISDPKAKIKINNTKKMLNIFSNEGTLLYKNNSNISLNRNDYFATITDKVNLEDGKFLLVEEDTFVNDINKIIIETGATVEIYNSKNQLIDINSALGTDYRIVIKIGNETHEYIIITNGDVTGDAEIDFFDVTKLYHYIKGITELKDTYEVAGNFARDDSIDFIDVTKLYHYTKGITPEV